MTTTIERLLAYEAWANQRILAAVQAMPPQAAERACTLLGHVASGLRVWHQRVAGVEQTAGPWDVLTLEQCAAALLEQQDAWTELLRQETDIDRVIKYRSMAGDPFETPLKDILWHLSFHSHYHRGQVNAAIRAAGCTPVNVDFIAFQREGH
jgi:uncharacterized damage-inducible protein DinB